MRSIRNSIYECIRITIMHQSVRIIVRCRIGICIGMGIRIQNNVGISVSVGAIASLVLVILSITRLQASFKLALAYARDSNCQICSRFVMTPQASLIVAAPAPQTLAWHSSVGVHYMHTAGSHAEQLLSTW